MLLGDCGLGKSNGAGAAGGGGCEFLLTNARANDNIWLAALGGLELLLLLEEEEEEEPRNMKKGLLREEIKGSKKGGYGKY